MGTGRKEWTAAEQDLYERSGAAANARRENERWKKEQEQYTRDYMGPATQDSVDMSKVRYVYPPEGKQHSGVAGRFLQSYEAAKKTEEAHKKLGYRIEDVDGNPVDSLEEGDVLMYVTNSDGRLAENLRMPETLIHEFGHKSDLETKRVVREGLTPDQHEYVYIRNAFRATTKSEWEDVTASYLAYKSGGKYGRDDEEKMQSASELLQSRLEDRLPDLIDEEASSGGRLPKEERARIDLLESYRKSAREQFKQRYGSKNRTN